ncbi:MAG: 2-oxoacid:ferredoxin oxidoreductase subunit beta [Bacteroidetes bacterium]|nr:2-oxoacid:ferredoxin oxidoreductase subunit beta [Bacteroidota bacterium]
MGKKPTLPPGAGKRPTMPPGPGKMPPGAPAGPPGGDGASVPTRADFSSDQDVRWCPGCGDYAILATVQRLMPELGVPRENMVFISGIGCSSRFPYYMNTYGMHSIHGRAPTIATGIKTSRPELDVWMITGDGDSLSIGGNHIIHIMRRNVDLQIIMFNNQIYGLTKGQYSPTSEVGKVTKSTPFGSIDHPFNPIALVLGADASFAARTMDRDPKHMKDMLKQAHEFRGTGFVEVYQNCNIFNDEAFFDFTEKATKSERAIFFENGKPLTYAGGTKGLRLNGFRLETINLENGNWGIDDCLVYDETSRELATIMARVYWREDLPQPFGVFFRENRPSYDSQVNAQIQSVIERRGKGSLEDLLNEGDTWEVS